MGAAVGRPSRICFIREGGIEIWLRDPQEVKQPGCLPAAEASKHLPDAGAGPDRDGSSSTRAASGTNSRDSSAASEQDQAPGDELRPVAPPPGLALEYKSFGSRLHAEGTCRPCSFHFHPWKGNVCRNGAECWHCHDDEHEVGSAYPRGTRGGTRRGLRRKVAKAKKAAAAVTAGQK
mmetsp:Transcript_16619/g.42285  ORF Transcript_16619/g.42285 Transcript_16619/m.42285 type:complete len:177 (-) Transcript_16619:111-641(-)